MPRTIEQRMRAMEEMIAEIHACVVMGRTAVPGEAEYIRAIEAMADGDMAPLTMYLRRGGIVPKAETLNIPAARQRCGANRSGRERR